MIKSKTIFLRGKSGFSMVEIMITVIIISTCFLAIFRVFSICTTALSEANSNVFVSTILRNKMNGIREKIIIEDGISATSSEEEITSGDKRFKYTENILRLNETAYEPSETLEEGEEEEETLELCSAKLNLTWKIGRKSRTLLFETILPAKDFSHEL